VERAILLIRGHRVLLDSDLAAVYGVPTKVLNQSVKRNRDRFPEDFMFQLTAAEVRALERRLTDHDEQIGAAFAAIRQLLDATEDDAEDPNRPRIGYHTELQPDVPPPAKPRRKRSTKSKR
jgi:hypothetical protein